MLLSYRTMDMAFNDRPKVIDVKGKTLTIDESETVVDIYVDEDGKKYTPEGELIFDYDGVMGDPSRPQNKHLKKFTPAGVKHYAKKSLEKRKESLAVQKDIVKYAKAYQKALKNVPEISAIDVIRMRMHHALQNDELEDAARWAKELAEFEKPKLQRVEKSVTVKTEDISDEELQKLMLEEGLVATPTQLQ